MRTYLRPGIVLVAGLTFMGAVQAGEDERISTDSTQKCVTFKAGQQLDGMQAKLKQINAVQVQFGYKHGIPEEQPHLEREWHQLPNGMYIEIYTDKKEETDPYKVFSLSVASSAQLKQYKAECWYGVDKIRVKAGLVSFSGLTPSFLHLGMTWKDAAKRIEKLGLKPEFEEGSAGVWRKVVLNKASELFVCTMENDQHARIMKLEVLHTGKVDREGDKTGRWRFQFEVVDLKAPFGEKFSTLGLMAWGLPPIAEPESKQEDAGKAGSATRE